jgi:hypothetical protein
LIKNPHEFGSLLSYEYGFDKFIREFIVGDILMPLYMRYVDTHFAVNDICAKIWF